MANSLKSRFFIWTFLVFLFLGNQTVFAQICFDCDDNPASNCGAPNCDFACDECTDAVPPGPDIPVDNGIGIIIAAGMALTGIVLYRKFKAHTGTAV